MCVDCQTTDGNYLAYSISSLFDMNVFYAQLNLVEYRYTVISSDETIRQLIMSPVNKNVIMSCKLGHHSWT